MEIGSHNSNEASNFSSSAMSIWWVNDCLFVWKFNSISLKTKTMGEEEHENKFGLNDLVWKLNFIVGVLFGLNGLVWKFNFIVGVFLPIWGATG